MIVSNIVKKEKLREVQAETLELLKESLINSFGPKGSNTIVAKNGALNQYSKDGHTILSSIIFPDLIEASVKSDIEEITRHIVKETGDGTTSAVILSSIIFNRMRELESDYSPYELVRVFKKAVGGIKQEILKNKQEFNADKAYDISLISTNGNEEVANNIKSIYEKHGNDVFIDVAISNSQDSLLKTYDGMTLNTGYSDVAYINDIKRGVCSIRNAKVYMFEDPVDTPEMFALFNSIIEKNIMSAYVEGGDRNPVPTVILAPMVSRDMSSYMSHLVDFMLKCNEDTKPPFLLITNTHEMEQIIDIARMCGCKPLKKYINPKQQEDDIKLGLAATPDSVIDFAGQADIVESDVTKTKFINPKCMLNADGTMTKEYSTLLEFLEAELTKAKENNEDLRVTGKLKRRINSLKSNMVEYLVGGVTVADRDSVRDLVEDSVLNCRSAAINGVGYGANYEALRASYILAETSQIHQLIFDAYRELSCILYGTSYNTEMSSDITRNSLTKEMPFNLKTNEWDGKVLCTIDSDIAILDAISKIITLMITANQFLCSDPTRNKYLMD